MFHRLFDLWLDAPLFFRLGLALFFLLLSSGIYVAGYIWPWGWGVGAALLLATFAVQGHKPFVPPSLTTKAKSTDFKSLDQKLTLLRRYTQLRMPVEDAIFDISYEDTTPPKYDIRVGLKIARDHVAEHKRGLKQVPTEEEDVSWCHSMVKELSDWLIRSHPAIYTGGQGNLRVVVFESDGIVLKRMLPS